MADVLVVDDDTDLAAMLCELLTDAGHRVRVAANGEEGLSELSRALPELVVLDVEMPVMDGPGMAYEMFIRDRGLERVPVVLVSGVVALGRVASRVGTPYFLGKPYSADAVLSLCARALAERRPPRPEVDRRLSAAAK
jgi:DNA-binding NtrC family response regulator